MLKQEIETYVVIRSIINALFLIACKCLTHGGTVSPLKFPALSWRNFRYAPKKKKKRRPKLKMVETDMTVVSCQM